MGLARSLLAASDLRRAQMLAAAVPPEAMAAAPVAPARGTMQLVPNWDVTRGGIRREAGAHWRAACALVAMNARAVARAEARGVVLGELPFTVSQIAIAETYRGLVEWRAGSGIKCASVEAGRGGSAGSGLFIDTFIEQGERLARLQAAIGEGAVMSPRRQMDRGNGRRVIMARDLVHQVIERGRDLSWVLRHYGWAANGVHRKELLAGLRGILDRMQGYA
jgi:hypothetical protein